MQLTQSPRPYFSNPFKKIEFAFSIFLWMALTSCTQNSYPKKFFHPTPASEERIGSHQSKSLTENEAKIRAHLITQVSYSLQFNLKEEEESFQGKTKINFEFIPNEK